MKSAAQIITAARALVADAAEANLVLTITQESTKPPRTGSYTTVVHVRAARGPDGTYAEEKKQ